MGTVYTNTCSEAERMKVVGIKLLEEFGRKHADIRKQLDAWLAEVKDAQWKTPQNIKTRYVNASFISEDRVIFNIKGNDYRLESKVNFKNQVVLVKRIGTHEEYNRWKF